MSFFDNQNPGIGGLDELTINEALLVQQLTNLSTPAADRILFYDFSAGGYAFLTAGTGLTITGTTITASGVTGTINEIAYFDSASSIASLAVATYPSLTELSYIKGVTSALQTQLNTKATLSSNNAFTVGGQTITVANTTNVKGLSIYANDTTNYPLGLQVGPNSTKVTSSTLVQYNAESGDYSDLSFNVAFGGWPTINLQSTTGTLASPLASSTGTVSQIDTYVYNSTPTQKQLSSLQVVLLDGTASSEDSKFIFQVSTAGTLTTGFEISGTSITSTVPLTVGTSNAITTGTIELGHAADTTISRVSAGVMAVEGSTVPTLSVANTFTATQSFNQILDVVNSITASGNAATVPITYRQHKVTNNSAATLTVTITTTSAVDGQLVLIRIYDFSAVAQTITWVNTENGEGTAPTTSNGSTTLPKTSGFIYNGSTSKWRCIF